MAIAVVTGASSGIGKAIVLRLLELNYKVYGLARTDADIYHDNFNAIKIDLQDSIMIESFCKTIDELDLLINAAGFGRFEPHEELSTATIIEMIHVNLTAPILLTNLLLRTLKTNALTTDMRRSTIINITSIEALKSSKFSALYTATKSGLRGFGNALFEEVRKSGVNVVTINPDMTESNFFSDLRFETSKKEDERLIADDIADTVENILSTRSGVAITEVTVRAQKFGIAKKSK
jgi:short-subunit dehydrogenase